MNYLLFKRDQGILYTRDYGMLDAIPQEDIPMLTMEDTMIYLLVKCWDRVECITYIKALVCNDYKYALIEESAYRELFN